MGRKWKMIAENYKSQLKNMNEQFLNKKYWKLKRNKIKFQYLEEKSKLVKDVEILKNHENYSKVPCKSEYVSAKWSEEELLHLIHGVSKYGTDWEGLFTYHRTHVNQCRSIGALQKKYFSVRQNPKQLLYLQEKAKFLNKEEEFESIRFDKVIKRMNRI